jgi:amino acid transporter
LSVGKWLTNAGAAARWTVTLLLIAFGLLVWWRFGSATPMTAATMRPVVHIKELIFWSVIAFAWTGPEAMSFMGGEIKNPRWNVPIGLAIAAPAIAIIYIAGTVSVLVALLPHDVNASAGVVQAIDRASFRFGWNAITPIAALLVALSCVGSAGAWLGAVARIPFVAGIDRYLPPVFGRMHPRWGSPVAALVTQAAIAALFIFLGQGGTSVKGAYDVLVSATVMITMVPFLFLFASAVKLRGTYAWLVVPAAFLGLTTTLFAIVFAGFPSEDDPNKALAVAKILGLTAMMLAGGAIIYFLGRGKAAERPSHTSSHTR